jgi:hypothetical protein
MPQLRQAPGYVQLQFGVRRLNSEKAGTALVIAGTQISFPKGRKPQVSDLAKDTVDQFVN